MSDGFVKINIINEEKEYRFALAQIEYLTKSYNLKHEENIDITEYCLRLTSLIKKYEVRNRISPKRQRIVL